MTAPMQPMQGKAPPIDPDHDRRRIKDAVKALLGKKANAPVNAKKATSTAKNAPSEKTPQDPHSAMKPLGGAEGTRLAKAASADDHDSYKALMPKFAAIATEIASRSKYSQYHDLAAVMLGHAERHLGHAKMRLDRPVGRIDGVRAAIGLRPTSRKHLDTAQAMLTSARNLTVLGDLHLFRNGDAPMTPLASNHQPVKGAKALPGTRRPIKAAVADAEGRKEVAGAAARFRAVWHQGNPNQTPPDSTPAP